jgi:hypothetical protein
MKYNLKFNFHDVLFSFLSLIFVGLIIISSLLSTPKNDGEDYAVVYYNNEVVKRMPLDKDDDFIMYKVDYPDLYGDELIVSVRNNKVFISKEDSPFHYCSYLGEISNRGSSLICAPNCVRVTIEGKEGNVVNNSDIDIVARKRYEV